MLETSIPDPLETTTPSAQPLEKVYQVKLYHPLESGNRCVLQGKSDWFMAEAKDKYTLRIKIETGQHDVFKGDKCRSCGALAKVSFNETSDQVQD